jgi:hypothetical protein
LTVFLRVVDARKWAFEKKVVVPNGRARHESRRSAFRRERLCPVTGNKETRFQRFLLFEFGMA